MKHRLKLTKRYYNMSPAIRTSFWFTICNFLQRGTAIVTVPVFTRLLTTEEYGVCNIYFVWFEIFILFTSLKIPYEGLNNGLIRFGKDKDAYVSSVLGLIMVMTMSVAFVSSLFHEWIDQITGLSSFLMVLMFIQLMFNPPLILWTNRERFDFNYRWPVVVNMISTILNPIIAIVAVLNTRYRVEARIISSVVVQSFFGLIMIAVLFYKGKTFFRKEYWSFALKFNLPLIFYYASQMILNQSDRIMINYYEGSGKAAIYSVAYSVGTIILLLISAVNGSLNPWMYRKLKAEKFQDIKNTVIVLCILIAGATFTLSMFAPDLIGIMATEKYSQAIWIIPPVSTGVFFIFLYMVFANVEMYYGENNGISVVSIICSVVNLILNAYFIPKFGYLIAGWTTLFSYILLTVLHYVLMKRTCKKHKVVKDFFPIRVLAFIMICITFVTFVALIMYKIRYLRYIVLILEIIVFLKFREKLFEVIKQMRKGAKEDGK